jgi:holo-[acyl-carrier protein] synthase
LVIGVGVDVVRIARFRRAMARHGRRLLDRLFTTGERERVGGGPGAARHLAVRFAAKEAALKALGTGWGQGVAWRDLEVVGGGRRPSAILLSGKAREVAGRRGITRTLVSLAHDGEYAVAFVVALGDGRQGPGPAAW